jgi:putative isomerase
MDASNSLNLLKNHIDITQVPFSDRGSRLLVYQEPEKFRLLVKLAERLTAIDPDIEAYLHRPPFMRDLALLDEAGEPLDFVVVSYPHLMKFQTSIGDFGLVFQDERTLSFGLPSERITGIRFIVNPQHWKSGKNGGVFKSIRNISYITNGEVIENRILPQQDGYLVELLVKSDADCSIVISIHPGGNLITEALPFSQTCQEAEDRWKRWFSRIPDVLDEHKKTYLYAWWVMANNLISPLGNVIYEAMTPSKMNYVGLWLWDSALHALAYRYIDPILARNQIRSMLAHQLPNGMLPDAVFDDGVVSQIDHPITGDVTKPPIVGWAILKIHEINPDIDFLKEVYVPLVRLNGWWFTMNDDDGDGIAQYNHPYSSGLDDSPLWDFGMPVESPDLNTYLCLQMSALSYIANAIGLHQDALIWQRRASSLLRRMVIDLWDDEVGLFWPMVEEKPIRVVTPFNLYPLWTGLLPTAINHRLVRHLTNQDEFGGEFVIPTVARKDPLFNPARMWRGPVWANINYFFIEALIKTGFTDLASHLRDQTLWMIMQHRGMYEYYDAVTGSPPATAAPNFGWTAAVFIDLAIQAYQAQNQRQAKPS